MVYTVNEPGRLVPSKTRMVKAKPENLASPIGMMRTQLGS